MTLFSVGITIILVFIVRPKDKMFTAVTVGALGVFTLCCWLVERFG
jgi:hypothetical protein